MANNWIWQQWPNQTPATQQVTVYGTTSIGTPASWYIAPQALPKEWSTPLEAGDVLILEGEKETKYAVVWISDPQSLEAILVKPQHDDDPRLLNARMINRCTIKRLDRFLSAVYKAQHGMVKALEETAENSLAPKPGL